MNSNSGTTLAITDMIRLLLEVYMAQGHPVGADVGQQFAGAGQERDLTRLERAQIRACSSS